MATTSTRLFKFLWAVICIGGFLYQSSRFLQLYLKYDTVIDIKVVTPKYIEMPSFTFCNHNGIRKSAYCTIYPHKCYSEDSLINVCKKYPKMCLSQLPGQILHLSRKETELEFIERVASREAMQKFGHQKSILHLCRYTWKTSFSCKNLWYQYALSTTGPRNCYVLNNWVMNSSNSPEMIPSSEGKSVNRRFADMTFFLSVESYEYMIKGREVAAQFVIHPPYELTSPFRNGMTLLPGYVYLVLMKISEVHLLPYPFSTDCVNYLDKYIESKGASAWSQNMCVEKCYADEYIKACGCMPREIKYAFSEKYCNYSSFVRCQRQIDATECIQNCKRDCRIIKYEYDVIKSPSFHAFKYYMNDSNLKYLNQSIAVTVSLKHGEIVTYIHRPKYEQIEFFGYIGGYLGMWLGFSLITICDYLYKALKLTKFYNRKKTTVTHYVKPAWTTPLQ